MSKFPHLLAGLSAISLAAAPALAHENKAEEAKEKPIALSQVPKAAVAAAQKALGSNTLEARLVRGHGQRVYELETKDASGKERSVHVAANGKILKTESE